MGTLARMDAISALFSDWASGLSGGGGGGSLCRSSQCRECRYQRLRVCANGGESMGAEATPWNTRSPAREETTGGTRSGRTLCGWSGEAGGSEGRSEYDQLGERHGASEHETRMSCQKEESRRTRRPARNFTDDYSSRYALRKIKVRSHVSGRPHVQRSLSAVYVCGRRTKMREVHGTHAWAALLE